VGRGLVTRAVRLIIDWAVDERGIHRVEWRVSSANEAGIAVVWRLGMRKDGVHWKSYLPRDGGVGAEVCSVLPPQWRAAASLSRAAGS
jgi:ribosomal-protein-serine acetyltransferase